MWKLLITLSIYWHQHSFDTNASWYGNQFHGRLTASGEVYHQDSLTAASPTLPFGTKVLVVCPDTRSAVIVRINDRGPYQVDTTGRFRPHAIRHLDLSREAFRQLAPLEQGIINIKFLILK